MIRALLLSIFLFSLSAVLTSCGRDEPSAIDVGLLSTDIHVSIAQHTLVLPFIALDDYAYRKQSFSLNRKGDILTLHRIGRDFRWGMGEATKSERQMCVTTLVHQKTEKQ